jgi:hypothetical protein
MNPALMQRVLKFGDMVHVAYAGGGGRVQRRSAKILTVNKGCADVRFLDDGDEKRIEYRNIEISEDIAARVPKKREPLVERKPVRRGLRHVGRASVAAQQQQQEEEKSMAVEAPPIPMTSVTHSPANPRTTSSLAAWLDMGREVEAELDHDLAAIDVELRQISAQREVLDARDRELSIQRTNLLGEKKRVAAVVRRA